MTLRLLVLTLSVSLCATGCVKPVGKRNTAAAAHATPPPLQAAQTSGEETFGVGEEVDMIVSELLANFARVYFEYDSATLTPDGREALRANAALLSSHGGLAVEVQGHADERGTTDYNLALGYRRAQAVRDYLGAFGVTPTRVRTVSYGEEIPLDQGGDEAAWSVNRRAEFRVLRGTGARGTVEG